MTTDIAKVKRNVKRMVDLNAPEEDIDAYIRESGTTLEAVRNYNPPKSTLQKFGDAISSAAVGTYDYIAGKQDPKFQGLPDFASAEQLGLESNPLAGAGLAKMSAFSDKAYGDIIKKHLGNKYRGSTIDKHGFEVISYQGDDGKEYQAYVNRPGLDLQDVDRTISQSIPFLIAGGLAGKGTKGAHWVARTLGQGAAGAGTSLGLDVVARNQGSEEDVDLGRAALAGIGGATFEALSGPVSRAWKTIFNKKGAITPDGKLSQSAREEAKKIGLNPDDMDARLSQQFVRDINQFADPKEFAAKQRTAEFGITTTKGQRTGHSDTLAKEQAMRSSVYGPEAEQIIKNFDRSQSEQIKDAALGQIRKEFAPGSDDISPLTLGQNIKSSVQEVQDAANKVSGQTWEKVSPLMPNREGLDLLPNTIAPRLKDFEIDPMITPNSSKMVAMLQDYFEGKPLTAPSIISGSSSQAPTINTMRKRLGKLTETDNRTDRAAAKEIYRGFNDWIDQLENRMLANGNIESASAMKTARAFTRGIRALFEPRGKDGQLTAAGRNIQKVLNDADSPESVINAILGSGGVNSSVPLGRIQTLMLVKKILSTKGKESWDDVRLAYWTRLVQDRKGQLLSPKVMKNNIDTAFNKQGSVLKTLFNEKERSLIQRFGQALKDATWVDPYPSKTPYGIEAFKRMKSGQSGAVGVGKTFASTAQKRETFSQHNYIMARIYQILNQKLSVLAGYRADKAGGQLALDTIRQDITKKKPPNLGSYGSFAGAEYTDD